MSDNENQPVAGTYLAFDYGTIRIGTAVGETLIGKAQPLQVVSNNSGTPDWDTIDSLLERWQPVGLVVGLPLTIEGDSQPVTHHTKGFGKRLRKRYALPVFLADERFTSMQAQQSLQQMRARGQRGRTRKQDIDTLAAALILERWFEMAYPADNT